MQPRSPLAEVYYPGSFGAFPDAPGIVLTERRITAAVQVNGSPEALGLGTAVSVLDLGAGQWLAVSSEDTPEQLLSRLGQLVANGVSILDASHAWLAVRVAGERCEDILAQGCPLDLDASVFPVGTASRTTLAGLGTVIRRLDDAFDLYVPRSFGVALWDWLTAAATSVGYRVHDSES